VQLIETSSIVLHYYRAGSAWLDITSCKPFDPAAAQSWLMDRIPGQYCKATTVELV